MMGHDQFMSPGTNDPTGEAPNLIFGFHHVRVPVRDAWISRDWYMLVFGFVPLLDLEEEQGLVGVVLRHPLGFVLGLHQDATRATALRGFAVLGFSVGNQAGLQKWLEKLDHLGISHGPLEEGHLGWYMDVPDPDGILIRLHTGTAPDAEEA